ncbi:MAG: response regulator, partial [Bdellovibrionales bacterium]|nr:response regulator [Bdellovibrionales bacterium]
MNKKLPRILLVDDEAENLKALERTLREHFDVVVMSDPLEALKVVGKGNFEVVVSDQRMPKMTG